MKKFITRVRIMGNTFTMTVGDKDAETVKEKLNEFLTKLLHDCNDFELEEVKEDE